MIFSRWLKWMQVVLNSIWRAIPSQISFQILIESFSRLAHQKNIKLEGKVQKDLDPVVMDAQRISRVISNLITNALRHTPAGGSVIVEGIRSGDIVDVNVSDTGEGLHEDDIPQIFDRFYRGEKSRSRDSGGAGLGLSIVQGIVEAHGGQIAVENLPTRGSRFTFSLPRKRLKLMEK